jgi:iron complex transport system ATP-binding protein
VISLRATTIDLGGVCVVDAVDLTVASAEWTMLIGRNGAGKTTLMRAIAGLIGYGGSITVEGREVRAVGQRERARAVALVPQSPLLPADMTVREYVLLGRTPHLGFFGRPGHHDDLAAEEALEGLDLTPLAGRRLDALSGGERQRAVLARALAQEAPVLLLDEPTTALDIGRQQEVLELVSSLRAERNLTVLGAMHDLTLAGQYADRLVLLDAGRVVADGPPDAVLTEERISHHYAASVRIARLDGSPVVLPARRASAQPDTAVRDTRGSDT